MKKASQSYCCQYNARNYTCLISMI